MAKRGDRDLGKEKFWRRLLRRWRHSGLGVRAFCAEHGVAEASFFAWRRMIAQRDQELARVQAGRGDSAETGAANGTPRFVPVRVIEATTPAAIEVVLPRGPVLRIPRGFDADALRQLLSILQEERPC